MPGLRSIPPLGKAGPKSPATVVPKAPPPSKTGGRPLPDLSRPTMAPRGPALLGLGQKRVVGVGGPGPQPADFPGSGAEWVWFWASRKYYWPIDHQDPRSPPYEGGLISGWVFQSPENPANPREPGGSVSDFVYLEGGRHIIVRIEGFFFHIGKGAAQQARDAFLVAQAGAAGDDVVRVNDDFMEDVTGHVAIARLADILAGRSPVGALEGGTVRPPRYANFLEGLAT